MEKSMAGLTLGSAPYTWGLTTGIFHFNPQNPPQNWFFFFLKKSNFHFQLPQELLVAQHTMGTGPASPVPCATQVPPSQAPGAAFGTSHTHPQSCKNEQFELCFIWKSEFSAPPTFFSPGRQHCQNVLFMQSSKRERKKKKKSQPN